MGEDAGWQKFLERATGNTPGAAADPHPTILSAMDMIGTRIHELRAKGREIQVLLIGAKLMKVLIAEIKESGMGLEGARGMVLEKFNGVCIHHTTNIKVDEEYYAFLNHEHFKVFIVKKVVFGNWKDEWRIGL